MPRRSRDTTFNMLRDMPDAPASFVRSSVRSEIRRARADSGMSVRPDSRMCHPSLTLSPHALG